MRGFSTVGSRFSLFLALLLGGASLLQPAWAGDSDRIERQIRLFERVLDDVLVESPNFLVQSSEVTFGRYREGEGAEFSFKTSLVGEQKGDHNWWNWSWGHDRKVIVIDEDDWDEMDRDDLEKLTERRRSRDAERQERRYSRGKEELVDALVDFGEVLTAVADDETITLRARLRRAEYFDQADLSRLTISVRMGDLRAHLAGRLSAGELESRISISES